MKNSVIIQLAFAFIGLASSAVVNASPSGSFEVRYAGVDSELTERYASPGAFDEESTVNLLWNSLSKRSGESEEAMEKRELEQGTDKRATCSFDYECTSMKYCSTKRGQCFNKLKYRSTCSRDGACSSGYCGRVSKMCARKKEHGATCYKANSACHSNYCSVVTDKCSRKRNLGERCYANAACKSDTCARNKCRAAGSHNPYHTPKPTASGTPESA